MDPFRGLVVGMLLSLKAWIVLVLAMIWIVR